MARFVIVVTYKQVLTLGEYNLIRPMWCYSKWLLPQTF